MKADRRVCRQQKGAGSMQDRYRPDKRRRPVFQETPSYESGRSIVKNPYNIMVVT